MAYAIKLGGQVHALSGKVDAEALLAADGNTIVYERSDSVRTQLKNLFSTGTNPQQVASNLAQLLCCLPQIDVPAELGYKNVFRVLLLKFLDAHDFDVRSVKRACIHIVHPDGRLIPFDTYNLFYRDQRETQLQQLRTSATSLPLG